MASIWAPNGDHLGDFGLLLGGLGGAIFDGVFWGALLGSEVIRRSGGE